MFGLPLLTAGTNSGTLAYSPSLASVPKHVVFVAALPNATQGMVSLKMCGSRINWSFPTSFKINLVDFSTWFQLTGVIPA